LVYVDAYKNYSNPAVWGLGKGLIKKFYAGLPELAGS